jgi:lipopolysaccharide biosynthesis glycosyltransferase
VASLVIACASDSRYALPLAVMLHSLAANLGPRYDLQVYAVDDNIGPVEKSKVLASLPNRVTLHWVEPQRLALSGLPTWGRMPTTTYQKLTLGEWLPAHVEKAMWLDCDLLVLDDVSALWEADLGKWHVLAVPDQRVPLVSSRFGVAAYRELGLSADASYFNAGVLLVDVNRWRRDGIASHALEYLNKYRDRIFFWDQEALNVVLAGKWGELDPGWNQNPSIDHLLRVRPPSATEGNYAPQRSPGNIHIAHFSGNLKPWNCVRSGPYHDLYFRYLDQTAWSGWRPTKTWKGMALETYESSRLRRFVYPAEQWATQIVRTFTRN